MPACDQRPVVGRKPTMPHSAAGMRTEPPVSEPMPPGTSRAATATPVPPLEPPGMRVGSYGLRAGAEGGVVVGHAVGELVQVGLAEHRSRRRRAAAATTGALRFGRLLAQAGRAAGGRQIGGVEVVLERERHAVQRAEPLAALAPAVSAAARRRAPRSGSRLMKALSDAAVAQRSSSASASASAVISPARIAAAASPTPSSASAIIWLPAGLRAIAKPSMRALSQSAQLARTTDRSSPWVCPWVCP